MEFQGFDVVTAQSGEEGVAVAASSSLDLVLMDLQLPGIGGHEALQRIRADSRYREVPVVAVTAFAMKDDVERAEAAGFDGYIAKPISVQACRSSSPSSCRPVGLDARSDHYPRRRRPAPEPSAARRRASSTRLPGGYASSGEQALEKLSDAIPDLVLLDIVMPGIDGYEVCRRIRNNPATAYLPVVMITASGDQEKISSIQAGADDFVSKPFNQGELLARVASLAR